MGGKGIKHECQKLNDLVGRRVKKSFKGKGVFCGKVISYYAARGLFRVAYDDGDREELEMHEVKRILVGVDRATKIGRTRSQDALGGTVEIANGNASGLPKGSERLRGRRGQYASEGTIEIACGNARESKQSHQRRGQGVTENVDGDVAVLQKESKQPRRRRGQDILEGTMEVFDDGSNLADVQKGSRRLRKRRGQDALKGTTEMAADSNAALPEESKLPRKRRNQDALEGTLEIVDGNSASLQKESKRARLKRGQDVLEGGATETIDGDVATPQKESKYSRLTRSLYALEGLTEIVDGNVAALQKESKQPCRTRGKIVSEGLMEIADGNLASLQKESKRACQRRVQNVLEATTENVDGDVAAVQKELNGRRQRRCRNALEGSTEIVDSNVAILQKESELPHQRRGEDALEGTMEIVDGDLANLQKKSKWACQKRGKDVLEGGTVEKVDDNAADLQKESKCLRLRRGRHALEGGTVEKVHSDVAVLQIESKCLRLRRGQYALEGLAEIVEGNMTTLQKESEQSHRTRSRVVLEGLTEMADGNSARLQKESKRAHQRRVQDVLEATVRNVDRDATALQKELKWLRQRRGQNALEGSMEIVDGNVATLQKESELLHQRRGQDALEGTMEIVDGDSAGLPKDSKWPQQRRGRLSLEGTMEIVDGNVAALQKESKRTRQRRVQDVLEATVGNIDVAVPALQKESKGLRQRRGQNALEGTMEIVDGNVATPQKESEPPHQSRGQDALEGTTEIVNGNVAALQKETNQRCQRRGQYVSEGMPTKTVDGHVDGSQKESKQLCQRRGRNALEGTLEIADSNVAGLPKELNWLRKRRGRPSLEGTTKFVDSSVAALRKESELPHQRGGQCVLEGTAMEIVDSDAAGLPKKSKQPHQRRGKNALEGMAENADANAAGLQIESKRPRLRRGQQVLEGSTEIVDSNVPSLPKESKGPHQRRGHGDALEGTVEIVGSNVAGLLKESKGPHKRRGQDALEDTSENVDGNAAGLQKESKWPHRQQSLDEAVPTKQSAKKEGSALGKSPEIKLKRPRGRPRKDASRQLNVVVMKSEKADESLCDKLTGKFKSSKAARSKSSKSEKLDGGTEQKSLKLSRISRRRSLKSHQLEAGTEQNSVKQLISAKKSKRKRRGKSSAKCRIKRKNASSSVSGPISNTSKVRRASQTLNNSDESGADDLNEQSSSCGQESSEDDYFSESCSDNDQECSGHGRLELENSVPLEPDLGVGEFELSHPQEITNLPPVKPLPPSSSQDIPMSDEIVPVLFSVYSFLRSFSRMLFLSPFQLKDFVKVLSLQAENELIDSIHVSLLYVLRRHLDRIAQEGSSVAEQCLRMLNWDFLDAVTWGSYLALFLATHSFSKVHKGGGNLYKELYTGNYDKLDVGEKLFMLGFLCDHVMDTEECRVELDIRENRNNNSQTTAKQDTAEEAQEGEGNWIGNIDVELVKSSKEAMNCEEDDDGNSDECVLCGMNGNLICCDGCPAAYHVRCLGVSRGSLPPGDWFCPECITKKYDGDQSYCFQGLQGAELLGVDRYGRSFMATCGHLLVSENLTMSDVGYKYYTERDIPKVLETLDGLKPFCENIQKAIACYWKIDSWGKELDIVKACGAEQGLLLPYENTETQSANGMEHNVPSHSPLQSQVLPHHDISNDPVNPQYCKQEEKTSDLLLKPDYYINHYHLGDVAATAAANLVQVTGGGAVTSLDSKALRRKKTRTTISEQLKAFSQAPVRFYWPSFKRKPTELVREKCGWCYTCAHPPLKKRCLLNQVASNLAAGAGRVNGGTRRIQSCSGHFNEVAGYLLYMEDNLYSLLRGPWESVHYRKVWRKQVTQATSVRQVKYCLLQLEANLREVVLLEHWFKQCEDVPLLYSRASANSLEAFPVSRKATTGSRSTGKVSLHEKMNNLSYLQWSRKGRLTRRVLDWHTLPSAIARVAGRQGGLRKIPDLGFAEGQEFATRTRQCAWIARVESATSVSDLAIQVRVLDSYIKWEEILSCEIVSQLNKSGADGLDLEADPAAYIHKRDLKNGALMYLVNSSLQSQIYRKPRISKDLGKFHVGDVEGVVTENKLIWVREEEVPLHFLRAYEERNLAANQNKHPKLAIPQRNHLKIQKVAKGNIFDFLISKNRTLSSWICGVCKMQVSLKNGVQCHGCEAVSHIGCCKPVCSLDGSHTILCSPCESTKQGSQSLMETHIFESNETQYSTEKKQKKSLSSLIDPENTPVSKLTVSNPLPTVLVDNVSESHKQASLLNSRQSLNSGTASGPISLRNGSSIISQSGNSWLQRRPMKPKLPLRKKHVLGPSIEGVNFKKDAEDKRCLSREHVMNGGVYGNDASASLTCFICKEAYNAELLYIRCQFCSLWFHAEALGVSRSNLSNVALFKCHRCRKKGPPICPYNNKNTFRGRKRSHVHSFQADNLSSSEGPHKQRFGITGNQPKDLVDLLNPLPLPVSGMPGHNGSCNISQENALGSSTVMATSKNDACVSKMNNSESGLDLAIEKTNSPTSSFRIEQTENSSEISDYKESSKMKMASSVGSLDLMEGVSEIGETTASSRDSMRSSGECDTGTGLDWKQESTPDMMDNDNDAVIDIQDISAHQTHGTTWEVSLDLPVFEGNVGTHNRAEIKETTTSSKVLMKSNGLCNLELESNHKQDSSFEIMDDGDDDDEDDDEDDGDNDDEDDTDVDIQDISFNQNSGFDNCESAQEGSLELPALEDNAGTYNGRMVSAAANSYNPSAIDSTQIDDDNEDEDEDEDDEDDEDDAEIDIRDISVNENSGFDNCESAQEGSLEKFVPEGKAGTYNGHMVSPVANSYNPSAIDSTQIDDGNDDEDDDDDDGDDDEDDDDNEDDADIDMRDISVNKNSGFDICENAQEGSLEKPMPEGNAGTYNGHIVSAVANSYNPSAIDSTQIDDGNDDDDDDDDDEEEEEEEDTEDDADIDMRDISVNKNSGFDNSESAQEGSLEKPVFEGNAGTYNGHMVSAVANSYNPSAINSTQIDDGDNDDDDNDEDEDGDEEDDSDIDIQDILVNKNSGFSNCESAQEGSLELPVLEGNAGTYNGHMASAAANSYNPSAIDSTQIDDGDNDDNDDDDNDDIDDEDDVQDISVNKNYGFDYCESAQEVSLEKHVSEGNAGTYNGHIVSTVANSYNPSAIDSTQIDDGNDDDEDEDEDDDDDDVDDDDQDDDNEDDADIDMRDISVNKNSGFDNCENAQEGSLEKPVFEGNAGTCNGHMVSAVANSYDPSAIDSTQMDDGDNDDNDDDDDEDSDEEDDSDIDIQDIPVNKNSGFDNCESTQEGSLELPAFEGNAGTYNGHMVPAVANSYNPSAIDSTQIDDGDNDDDDDDDDDDDNDDGDDEDDADIDIQDISVNRNSGFDNCESAQEGSLEKPVFEGNAGTDNGHMVSAIAKYCNPSAIDSTQTMPSVNSWDDENSRDLFTFAQILSSVNDLVEAPIEDMGKRSEDVAQSNVVYSSCAEEEEEEEEEEEVGTAEGDETEGKRSNSAEKEVEGGEKGVLLSELECAVCFDPSPPDLQCCGCGLAVHRGCYDEHAPVIQCSGQNWMCDTCKAG